jgi:DNA-binding NtrC family response regulator
LVRWLGRPPDETTLAALREQGIRLADGAGEAVVAEVVTRREEPRRAPNGPWLWLAGAAVAPDEARAAVAGGAYDVIDARRPAEAAALLAKRIAELAVTEPPIPAADTFVAESDAARAVLREIARAARTSMPVLLTGETGTGKEVAARLLHAWSAREKRRFVPINCAAIPNDLIEAELFGYAKGAFTGSVRAYEGQLAAAEGGTVFLDEVDDTPLPFQVKLLRVLEDRVVDRIGDNEAKVVDFRILAATNRDLGPLCASAAFGADLYERLAIVSIHLPPLRERLSDLPALVDHFVRRFYREEPASRDRHQVAGTSAPAAAALAAYPWPGNVRELRNVIFQALVRKRAGDELLLSDLPVRVLRRDGAANAPAAASNGAGAADGPVSAATVKRLVDGGGFDLRRAVGELERAALEAALARAGGNAAAAARLLGRVGRGGARDPGGTVRAMMRRLGVGTPAAAASSSSSSSTSSAPRPTRPASPRRRPRSRPRRRR